MKILRTAMRAGAPARFRRMGGKEKFTEARTELFSAIGADVSEIFISDCHRARDGCERARHRNRKRQPQPHNAPQYGGRFDCRIRQKNHDKNYLICS